MNSPENESGAAVLQKLDEQLNKYRFMDANLQQKKKRLSTAVNPVLYRGVTICNLGISIYCHFCITTIQY